MRTFARWLLLPFVGIAASYLAAFTVVALDWVYWQFDYPCPEAQIVSGTCPTVRVNWYATYSAVMECIGAGLAAIYVVVSCTWIAPSHKQWVALVVYGIGSLVAIWMGLSIELYVPMVIALAVGAAAVVLVNRRHVFAHAA